MTSIKPAKMPVALKAASGRATFTFSRTWFVPCLESKLWTGLMTLLNITFLAADRGTAWEEVLLGLQVLRHYGIDPRTLLEQQLTSLDVTDYSVVHNQWKNQTSNLGRLLLVRKECLNDGSTHSFDTDWPVLITSIRNTPKIRFQIRFWLTQQTSLVMTVGPIRRLKIFLFELVGTDSQKSSGTSSNGSCEKMQPPLAPGSWPRLSKKIHYVLNWNETQSRSQESWVTIQPLSKTSSTNWYRSFSVLVSSIPTLRRDGPWRP